MTSVRRQAANRANAKRSTGPRTAAGKARSAANSRRHGLTASPETAAVLRWYRLILDDPGASLDPMDRNTYRRAARELAEAEAHLERVRRAEEENFRDGNWHGLDKGDVKPLERRLVEARHAGREEEAACLEDDLEHAGLWHVKPEERRRRVLARYRASAEAQRRKALRRWIAEITKRTQ